MKKYLIISFLLVPHLIFGSNFLQQEDLSARNNALGHVNTAFVHGANAIHANPAALGIFQGKGLSLSYWRYIHPYAYIPSPR